MSASRNGKVMIQNKWVENKNIYTVRLGPNIHGSRSQESGVALVSYLKVNMPSRSTDEFSEIVTR